MNNETRYNFVLFGLKRDDLNRFDEIIVEKISENLLADGIEKALVDNYLLNHKQVRYTPTSERSILSQMNDMILVALYELEEIKAKDIEQGIDHINRMLNRFVFLKLSKSYSGETMHEALRNLRVN